MEAPSRAGGFFCSGLLNSVIYPLRIVLFVPIGQRYSVTSNSTIQSHRTVLFPHHVRIRTDLCAAPGGIPPPPKVKCICRLG